MTLFLADAASLLFVWWTLTVLGLAATAWLVGDILAEAAPDSGPAPRHAGSGRTADAAAAPEPPPPGRFGPDAQGTPLSAAASRRSRSPARPAPR